MPNSASVMLIDTCESRRLYENNEILLLMQNIYMSNLSGVNQHKKQHLYLKYSLL
jgi:hypothetical protein